MHDKNSMNLIWQHTFPTSLLTRCPKTLIYGGVCKKLTFHDNIIRGKKNCTVVSSGNRGSLRDPNLLWLAILWFFVPRFFLYTLLFWLLLELRNKDKTDFNRKKNLAQKTRFFDQVNISKSLHFIFFTAKSRSDLIKYKSLIQNNFFFFALGEIFFVNLKILTNKTSG